MEGEGGGRGRGIDSYVVGRYEDSDRCVRWLGRTPKQIKNINIFTFGVGRIGSHTLRGMAFLRTKFILF